MRRIILIIVIIGSIFIGYAQEVKNQPKVDAERLQTKNGIPIKVYVDKKGQIFADRNKIRVSELDKKLKELKEKDGIVYYSRENATGEPPVESIEVIELVIKHELPIKFYTDKTFTTPVKID